MTDATVTMRTTESPTEAERAAIVDVCNAANQTDDFRRLFTYFIPRVDGTSSRTNAVATRPDRDL